MRGASTVIVACCLVFAARAESPRRTLQASTEQAADAPGWNGRLPDGIEAGTLRGAGSRIGLDTDYGGSAASPGNRGYSYGYGYGFDGGPCGLNRGLALPGIGRSSGSIGGGTFRSTVRCGDGSPGLPLRERLTPGGNLDIAPPYRSPYDDRDRR